jgi:hypothetical protein
MEEDTQEKYCDLCGSITHNQSEHDEPLTTKRLLKESLSTANSLLNRNIIERLDFNRDETEYGHELESLSERELINEVLFLREGIKTLFAEGHCGNQRPPRDVLCQRPKGHKGRHIATVFWERSRE